MAKNGNGSGPAGLSSYPAPEAVTPAPSPAGQRIVIPAPDIRVVEIPIEGTAPLMVHKFSEKARKQMEEKQAAGSSANKNRARSAKDFDAVFHEARHISTDGWDGYPAGGLRAALISACRLVGFKMTIAKLSVFIVADGIDRDEGTPLVKILGGEPEKNTMHARNETGVADIRIRPMWRNWTMRLRVQYDADQFTPTDVVNLVSRAGIQVGIGEGRPDSKKSTGMGLGTFRVVEGAESVQ